MAIKILPPQFMAIQDVVARFKREAQLASRLKHPNTITIHDYGQDQGLLYIVMELLSMERTSPTSSSARQSCPPERILHIARQILKSLAEAHKHAIVHRDLKPENIFLEHMDGETDFVKVLDFGIAKLGPARSGNAWQTFDRPGVDPWARRCTCRLNKLPGKRWITKRISTHWG